jgi:hypothetical protein
MNEQLYRADSAWIGDYELVRYANLSTDGQEWHEVGLNFGDSFVIKRYATSQNPVRAGQTLGLQLEICRAGPITGYHHLFTHLLSPGRQVSGFDGPVRYGGTLVVPWEEGDCLVERRALPIAPETPPGRYELIAGFDTPDGPLAVETRSGQQSNYAILGEVQIMP